MTQDATQSLTANAGYSPMFSGDLPSWPSPFANATGSPLLNMGMQMLMPGVLQNFGMAPVFANERNLYDSWQAQQFYAVRMQAMQHAAELDRDKWMSSMRGVSMLAGVPWGASQVAAAGRIADTMTTIQPYIAMVAPEFLDQLAGPQGSATALAATVASLGRYRRDPVSGRFGLDAINVNASTTALMEAFYDSSPLSMGAGRAGAAYRELFARGLGGRGLSYDDLRTDRRIAESVGLDFEELSTAGFDRLNELAAQPDVADKIARFDATKIKSTLSDYTKAINAVRDIFGDAGNPNAPMAELFKLMEQLSGGSLAGLSADQVGRIARNVQQTVQMTGVSMGAFMQLQHAGVQRAGAMGLDPIFATTAAQHGAVFFGVASGLPMWGASSAQANAARDAELTQNAASSQMANMAGAVLRMDDAGLFADGSEGALAAARLRSGDPTALMNPGQLNDLLTRAGFSQAFIGRTLKNTSANQEYIAKHGIELLVRNHAQPVEAQAALASAVANTLTGAGLDGRKAGEITASVLGLSEDVFTNSRKRVSAIADILESTAGVKGEAAKRLAMSVYDAMDMQANDVLQSPLADVYRLFSPTRLSEVGERLRATDARSEVADLFAPFYQDSGLRRVMGVLQDPAGADLPAVIGSAFGAVVARDLEEPMRKLHASESRLMGIADRLSKATSPQEKASLQAEFNKESNATRTLRDQILSKRSLFLKDNPAISVTDIRESVGAFEKLIGYAPRELNATNRRVLSDAIAYAREQSRDLVNALSQSDALRVYGEGAVAAVKGLADANDALEMYAQRYAGGDMAKFWNAEFSSTLSPKELEAASAARESVIGRVRAASHTASKLQAGDPVDAETVTQYRNKIAGITSRSGADLARDWASARGISMQGLASDKELMAAFDSGYGRNLMQYDLELQRRIASGDRDAIVERAELGLDFSGKSGHEAARQWRSLLEAGREGAGAASSAVPTQVKVSGKVQVEGGELVLKEITAVPDGEVPAK